MSFVPRFCHHSLNILAFFFYTSLLSIISIYIYFRYYPFRATYDIETMFKPTDKERSAKLEWVNRHSIVSISICSNVPNYKTPKNFAVDDTPNIVEASLEYLDQIGEEAYNYLCHEYNHIFNSINTIIEGDLDGVPKENMAQERQLHPLDALEKKLHRYLHELPVIGFNSGKYDINAMKIDFFSVLAERNLIQYAVKRNNNFMCVKTKNLKFLDITNYLAPGFSYGEYLKAYKCTEEKGHFPYEWLTSVDKLNDSRLPPHDAFFSKLKNANITDEEYQHCQSVFTEFNMTSMKDFLVWYNNKDVKPMLEAIEKMFQFYKNRKIDMFKDGISVPGLTLKYMFQDLPFYFTLATEKYKDVYHLLKNNIVGGPSIVFHRYHEKDVTSIRPNEYDNPKPCKKIVGFDANALYLWSIMQDMPTGHFSVRKAENEFKRITQQRYIAMAIDWLEWEAKTSGHHIRHQGNNTEKLIGLERKAVDGYCKETKTVYEFQGCLWHGHDCKKTKQHNGIHPKSGKSFQELRKSTQNKIDYIREQGYTVVELWECEWEQRSKDNQEIKQFVKERKRPCDWRFTMTERQIIDAVQNDKLFGALEVDIEVPDQLKPKFSEMPPIFKNVEISRDDIGDHMKTYAVERDMMSQLRKSLIGSYFGTKIMVITPLLKWYLAQGLIVTKIHQVVEYTPAKCFQQFGNAVSNARREGDADPDKKIIAETNKLDGNSSYGKTVTNKEKHTDMVYCNAFHTQQYLCDPLFRKCNQLNEDTFEIEMAKKSTRLDLPLQIGCFVYQYAKLRMLQFYYDFMDTFVDRRDFQYCSMDTDSAYMALSGDCLDDIIKPDMKDRYLAEKHLWFPRTDTPEHAAYDKRTPGLFKEEFSGDGIIALCSKTYFCYGKDIKYSCKGINKRLNTITKDTYMDVLLTKKSGSGTNRGFRSVNNQIYTYLQERAGFSYFYPKRKVLDDGISTVPLDI